jgi:hypothetical protein
MRRQVVQTDKYSVSIPAESFHQLGGVRKRHQSYFVLWPQSLKRFQRRVPDLLAEWIETASSINEQYHGQRKGVLAEVSDLLSDPVFRKDKIFLLQIASYAAGFLLDYLCVENHQINRESYILGVCSRRADQTGLNAGSRQRCGRAVING